MQKKKQKCKVCGNREVIDGLCPICRAYEVFLNLYEQDDQDAKAIMENMKLIINREDERRRLFYVIGQMIRQYGAFAPLEKIREELKKFQLEHLYDLVLKHAIIGISLDKETMKGLMPDCEESKTHICLKSDNKFYCLKCGKEAPLKEIKPLRIEHKEAFIWTV